MLTRATPRMPSKTLEPRTRNTPGAALTNPRSGLAPSSSAAFCPGPARQPVSMQGVLLMMAPVLVIALWRQWALPPHSQGAAFFRLCSLARHTKLPGECSMTELPETILSCRQLGHLRARYLPVLRGRGLAHAIPHRNSESRGREGSDVSGTKRFTVTSPPRALHTTIGYDSCLYLRHPLTDQPTAIQQAASSKPSINHGPPLRSSYPPFYAWLRSPYPFFPLLPNQTREPWHQLQIDGQNRKWKHEICDSLRCRAFDLYEKQISLPNRRLLQ